MSTPAASRSDDLVADRERELLARLRARLVVAHERPHQHRHRAGQHALHLLVRERLRVLDPVDRHRVRARHVAEDDRRAHVARAVALHPRVVREHVAVHLLGEVLHHVVALGLAVHEHVEADVLLQADHALDLALHQVEVLALVDLALAQAQRALADLGRLRERADRRGREQRQPEPLVLRVAARRRTRSRGWRRRRSPARAARAPAGCGCAESCAGPRAPGGSPRASSKIASRPSFSRARERRHLVELLHGERHPAQDLVVEARLVALVDRRVLQRAGRRDDDVVAGVPAQLLEQVEACARGR